MSCMSPLYATPPLSPISDTNMPNFEDNFETPSAIFASHPNDHFARDTHMRIILGNNSKEANQPPKWVTHLHRMTWQTISIKILNPFPIKTENPANAVASQPIRPFVCCATGLIRPPNWYGAPIICSHHHPATIIRKAHPVSALNRERFSGAKKVKCRHVAWSDAHRFLLYYYFVLRHSFLDESREIKHISPVIFLFYYNYFLIISFSIWIVYDFKFALVWWLIYIYFLFYIFLHNLWITYSINMNILLYQFFFYIDKCTLTF